MARLHVRLIPRGGKDLLEGWEMDGLGRTVLKARVASIPSEGQANASLITLIASALGVSPSKVRITKGRRSRLKTLEIEGLVTADFRSRLEF
jgi:uncharacterized protein YggU (UPF0235/DUF167 family)